MLMKKLKHKTFNYEPRFYKPENDPELKRRHNIKFAYNSKLKSKKKIPIGLLIIFIIIVLVYLKLAG